MLRFIENKHRNCYVALIAHLTIRTTWHVYGAAHSQKTNTETACFISFTYSGIVSSTLVKISSRIDCLCLNACTRYFDGALFPELLKPPSLLIGWGFVIPYRFA